MYQLLLSKRPRTYPRPRSKTLITRAVKKRKQTSLSAEKTRPRSKIAKRLKLSAARNKNKKEASLAWAGELLTPR